MFISLKIWTIEGTCRCWSIPRYPHFDESTTFGRDNCPLQSQSSSKIDRFETIQIHGKSFTIFVGWLAGSPFVMVQSQFLMDKSGHQWCCSRFHFHESWKAVCMKLWDDTFIHKLKLCIYIYTSSTINNMKYPINIYI